MHASFSISRSKRACQIILSLSIIFSSMLRASDDFDDLFSLSLQELVNIQITGSTLTQENIKTVPAAVTVFSYQQIQNMGFDYLSELMAVVPGFQAYRVANISVARSFSSRGRRIGANSSEVLVLMDGQRLNQSFSGGSVSSVPAISLDNIERVEFIRGPGSAIYGSNAMTGIINIITKIDENNLAVAYGSNEHNKLSLQGSGMLAGVKSDVFMRVEDDRGQAYWVDDPFSNGQVNIRDPYYLSDTYLKLGWQDLELNIQYNDYRVSEFYNGGTAHNSNTIAGDHGFFAIKHAFNWQKIDGWARISHSRANNRFSSLFPIPSQISPTQYVSKFSNSETHLQWHNRWQMADDENIQFGFELRNVPSPSGKTAINQGPSMEKLRSSSRDILGLYSQYQLSPTSQSHLTLGLRYDNFSGIGSKVSPRFSWVQELANQQSIKLLYGEAFRAPSEVELNLVATSALVGNPDLTPETVKTLDVIWFSEWPSSSVSLGYFENYYENTINEVVNTDGVLQPSNVPGSEHSRGFELEAMYEFSGNLFAQASYSQITDKPKLFFREAQQLMSIILNYHNGNWNHNVVASYSGSRHEQSSTIDKVNLDSYWLLYGKISYSFSSQLQSFLQVKNMSDQSYSTPASFIQVGKGVPNRGSEISMGVNWTF